MILLYTEKVLKEAYSQYILDLAKTSVVVVPTLEEFRVIFEEYWKEQYEQEE
jgi:hypothetical protein